MSKRTNQLRMIIILNQEDLVKIRPLQELFDISGKQVRRYREELCEAGFTVESVTGKNGGYRLVHKEPLLETQDIYDKVLTLIGDMNISLMKAYQLLISYITNDLMRSVSLYNLSSNELHHLITLNESIKNPFKQNIKYGYENDYILFSFQPYFVYKRYNTWFVVGYSNHTNNVTTLEISYILEIKQSNDKFSFPIADANLFKKRLKHMIGVTIPGKKYRVKIQTNQLKLEDLENLLETSVEQVDNYYYFDSYSLLDTKRKILSLGSMVIVKEPFELVSSIEQDLVELSNIYKPIR